MGWSRRRIARALGRSQPEVKRLLVDLDDDVGLFALGALEAELTELLGRAVDVVPERSLRPAVRETMRPIPL